MNSLGAKKKLATFIALIVFLSLQICFLSLTTIPAKAAAAGWFVEYTNSTQGIYGVSAVDANTCWAVGEKQTDTGPQPIVLKTTNAGGTWTTYTPSTTAKLTCISAVSSSVCYVGGMGVIMKTTNGGSSWTTVYSDSNRAIMDISAASSSVCWAVGCNPNTLIEGFILYTNTGGTLWIPQMFGLLYPVMGVSAVDSLTCWAVGGTYNPLTGKAEGSIFRTITGGLLWLTKDSTDCAYWDVSAVSSSVAWVNGVSFTTSPIEFKSQCFRTSDGGSSWSTGPSPSLPIPFYHGLQAIDANNAWQATVGPMTLPEYYTGSIYKTTNGGASWSLQACTALDQQLAGLSGVNANTAWAVGSDIYNTSVPSKGIIMHTTDGGKPPLPSLTSVSPSSGYMGAEVTLNGANFGPNARMSKVTFGDKQASIVSWSDTQIKCKVPSGLTPGTVKVAVTTLGGTSGSVNFTVNAPAAVNITSVNPNGESQFGLFKALKVQGSGFQQGAKVKLDKTTSVIYANSIDAVSSTEITCTFLFFGQEPGTYDVVVENPDGGVARLAGAFTLLPICGSGSGSALLLLGITLGLLSLAGSGSILRRRRKKTLG